MELIYFDPSSQVNEFFFKSCYPDKSAIKTSPSDESILFVSIDLRLLPNMGPLQWEAQEITTVATFFFLSKLIFTGLIHA